MNTATPTAQARSVPSKRSDHLNAPAAKIAKEGRPFIIAGLLAGGLLLLLGSTALGSIALAFGLFSILFFRNPQPKIPALPGVAVSPAHGKVVVVERAFEPHFLKDDALHIAVFLNVVDVHINRAPVRGRVLEQIYHPGRFFSATTDKCADENERNHIVFECDEEGGRGEKVLLTQIAGLIARRIVSHVRKGDTYERGEAFGLIRFGSRTDIWLPADTRPLVAIGDRVVGGETILGELRGG